MSTEKQKPSDTKAVDTKSKGSAPAGKANSKSPVAPAGPPPPLFRRADWISFWVTTLLVFIGYWITLSPNLTLEDSGELAVGSFYAGVPHPPGYPVWTLYTWFFTQVLPFSNIAWRVAMSSAVAGAFACGIIALMVSRGCSLMLEGIDSFKDLERRWESAMCVISGFVAGMLLGFNGFMWSQAVIVEVYTLSVLSLMGVLVCLMRWMYAPDQRKYLYWAAFWFGICFTNHQTLICAAMGIEVAVLARQPKLGRDLLLVNSVCYLAGLALMAFGIFSSIRGNHMLFVIFNVIGVLSIIGCGWLTISTEKLLSEWKPSVIIILLGALGASFYLYMPLASMSNPPMNWGYPRTVEGFFHALSRGQYESTKPTSEVTRLIEQVDMLKDGAIDEFNIVYLALAVLPFVFLRRMHARDRAWMYGLAAIYFCLAFLLLILLSPTPDRTSRELTKVFFTASHVMISMWIGYGLAILGALIMNHYERCRYWLIGSAAVGCAFAVYGLLVVYGETNEEAAVSQIHPFFNAVFNLFKLKIDPSQYWLVRATAGFGVVLAGLYTLLLVVIPALGGMARRHLFMPVFLVLFALIPVQAIMGHWSGNEQRGHLFGYWFGHDMFTPPFNGKDGKPLYPEMARNAVLFGGTDPGRFCPTYMIFCESFIPAAKKEDPKFDRRDVYIITQNALADATYLMYIRAHYNRSTQKDPFFFSQMLRSIPVFQKVLFEPLAKIAEPLLDKPFTALGAAIEEKRRKNGVYPPKEIHTPGPEDSQKAFEDYVQDAHKRKQHDDRFPNEPRQLKPGEDVNVMDNRIQVSGQVAVMSINGLLTKNIFDKNPEHEFYVEESFPLDWMYPYLTPFGIIMKINRQQVPEFTQEIVDRDHEFWSQFSNRLIGNWITYDTPVTNICEFAERVFAKHDYSNFKGDPKFIRDDDAQKAFSKLRSALAGLYSWRIGAAASNSAEQQRLIKEAEFAFKQSFAFCPYSPEAVFRYTNLLLSLQRVDDALAVARTFRRLDPYNPAAQSLIDQLMQMKGRTSGMSMIQNQLAQMEQQFQASPTNLQMAITLFNAYLEVRQTNRAVTIIDRLMANPEADANTFANAANAYSRIPDLAKMENAIGRLVGLNVNNPEAWYDLAAIQAASGKIPVAVESLKKAVLLSDERLKQTPGERNLRDIARTDARFGNLQKTLEFQSFFNAPPK